MATPDGGFSSVIDLTALEVAVARPLGLQKGTLPLGEAEGDLREPVLAFEAVLTEALARPPCLVSFSGGRDSSGVLALAAKVSRQHGLTPPVPATLVFPGDDAADEEQWQALVLKDLALPDWARITVHPGELDVVGPVAAKVLRRHGLLWPFNAHFHVPIIERATGGSVVTGIGGDEVAWASVSSRPERLLARQERVARWRTAASLGYAFCPRPVREVVCRLWYREEMPWLTRPGRSAARSAISHDSADVPFGFDRKLGWAWRSRYCQLTLASYKSLATANDVHMLHPFADQRVLEALAATGGIPGFGSRRALVRRLFGGVMPNAVMERVSKATFTNQSLTDSASSFGLRWSGRGLDHELVDVEWLKADWSSAAPHPRTVSLLQAAWLHDQGMGPPVPNGLPGQGGRGQLDPAKPELDLHHGGHV